MSAATSFAIIPLLIVLSIIIIIPILICIYVYRDASRRGMNAILWTLIAALAPALVGFIIYLLVRSGYSDLQCPACMAPVTEQYMVCPKCGARLKASCPSCGFPAEPDWTVCPKCATSLPENVSSYTVPAKKKDTALGKILVAVILIPIILLVLVAVLSYTNYTSGFTTGTTSLSVDEYKEHPEIMTWINSCDENSSKIYALRYTTESGGQKATYCLIYRPSAGRTDAVDVSYNVGLGGTNIEARFIEDTNHSNEEYKYKLTCISSYSNKHAGLMVFINGKKVACETTDVDFNPALFEQNQGINTNIAPANK